MFARTKSRPRLADESRRNGDAHDPSPEEIDLACLTIQARWSDDELESRRAERRGYVHFSKAIEPESTGRFLNPDRE